MTEKSNDLNFENRIAKNDKYLLIQQQIKFNGHDLKQSRAGEFISPMDINFLTMESLILAQDERWRRASYMQVEREIHFGGWKVADG